MARLACVLLSAVLFFLTTPAWPAPFNFATGQPDGRMAAASRIESGALIEIEAADDFITTADQTTITAASFWGLLTGATTTANIAEVVLEIYRVFPLDSSTPPSNRVPTRTNSPSDVAFDSRSSDGEATFVASSLGPFAANNSVVNGINAIPNQTTGGEGPVPGTQVKIDVTLTSPFRLPPGHYFFVPQVRLSNGSTFLWLSTAGNQPPLFTGDLQAWIRNANLDPDWLRIGTDIVGGTPAPTFDMAFSLSGSTESATLTAAVLPSSRSVKVGDAATAFVTVINPGVTVAEDVAIILNTGVPVNFVYQTTDPTTNQVTGTPNTPVDIPAGQNQTFVVGLTPTGPFDPTDVAFAFSGGNARTISGVNTLLLSASNTPVADIVALSATPNANGIVDIPGANGNAAFAVATVNVGATGTISATADTGTASLPVILFMCETNAATGQCVNPAAPTTAPVVATIAAGATKTFGVFVAATGVVPFDPSVNRVVVRFREGVVRGATSVALRTQ